LARHRSEEGATRYVCQATELSAGSVPVRWGDPRHYLKDLVRGNVRFLPLLTGTALYAFNRAQRKRHGAGFPYIDLPAQTSSPHAELNLQPGEVVRVKSKHEIEATLNSKSLNRGLSFDIEMVRHCGHEYRVAARVVQLIEERTGLMKVISNPCIILEGVSATAEYNGFCAQNEAVFWREIWLERAAEAVDGDGGPAVLRELSDRA
jgi:hypothetical protein